MQVKYINEFLFRKAEYQVSDGNGSIIMIIDYKNNNFTLERIGLKVSKALELEAKTVAEDLLSRKVGVNFADRFRQVEQR